MITGKRNESEVESSFVHSFVSECLYASSKAAVYVPPANDDSKHDSVIQDIIMDKNKVGLYHWRISGG